MPALLKAQSSRPKVFTAAATMASTSAARDTSQWTKRASPPASRIARTVCSPPSSAISATSTRAPSRAKIIAADLPIPDAAPVISALLPASNAIVVSPDFAAIVALSRVIYQYAEAPAKVSRRNYHASERRPYSGDARGQFAAAGESGRDAGEEQPRRRGRARGDEPRNRGVDPVRHQEAARSRDRCRQQWRAITRELFHLRAASDDRLWGAQRAAGNARSGPLPELSQADCALVSAIDG